MAHILFACFVCLFFAPWRVSEFMAWLYPFLFVHWFVFSFALPYPLFSFFLSRSSEHQQRQPEQEYKQEEYNKQEEYKQTKSEREEKEYKQGQQPRQSKKGV